MSITQVWERLFVGGLADAEALAESNALGITTVISPCQEVAQRRAPGINYLHFPLREAGPIPAGRFDAIVDALFENVRWGTVLIHSRTGKSRAPIVAAAWMHVVGCKGIDAALEEIGRLRPIRPNQGLLKKIRGML